MDKDDQLRRLHEVELEILMEFHRICDKHKIQYFLDSGSALGAVRHKGFIPWDDDIDVGMLRSEYNRFMKVAPQELGTKFYLQHRGVEPNYPKFNAKLRMEGTYFPENNLIESDHNGIFIDIFPFDSISDNPLIAKFDYSLFRRIRGLWRIKTIKSLRWNITRKIVAFFLIPVPTIILERLLIWSMNRKNNSNTHHVTCFLYGMCEKRNIIFKKEWIYPSVNIDFEREKPLIMNGYHEYLTEMYHDYMQLPPVEKRHYHCIGTILFNSKE